MKRAFATSLSISALIVGVSAIAFGLAKLLTSHADGLQQSALPIAAVALGLVCWIAGVTLARMGKKVRR